MPRYLNRSLLRLRPLAQRKNLLRIEEIAWRPEAPIPEAGELAGAIEKIASRVVQARRSGRPVILCYGAHLIKNGLAPLLERLAEAGWLTHLATNGAGSIRDWEFAYQGQSAEDVREGVERGEFGLWEETGRFINLAVLVGGYRGLGYGCSVAAMIEREELIIPAASELEQEMRRLLSSNRPEDSDQLAAAADLREQILRFALPAGVMRIAHPCKRFSIQAAAARLQLPYTVHPGIGYDIIYQHPMNHGGAIGRGALRDFLSFAAAVSELSGGLYLSVGSAIMSPMIFEKTMAMAQNLARQRGARLEHYLIVVNDLAPAGWDWSKGEPPASDPAYYIRYSKSFSRMGGQMLYLPMDNRAFLGRLYAHLQGCERGATG